MLRISATGCPDLANPDNGMVGTTGNTGGDTATYTCGPGFRLVGEEMLTCLTVGAEWSGPVPECQRISKMILSTANFFRLANIHSNIYGGKSP